jgi:uncharacterized caspase-like protein
MRVLVAIILAIWSTSFCSEPALAGKRVALVIGNSDYQNAAGLRNPAKDAVSMAKLFKEAGFDTVAVETNVDNVDFKSAIRNFEDTAIDSDIAVVFYTGHGIEIGGANYLLPIDAKLATDSDAPEEAISLERLVESAKGAKRLRLIILDASRANPFIKTMKHTMTGSSNGQGLTKVAPADTNSLIAYSAKAGSTVDDDDGEHSPFTTALLTNLTVPGLDIRLAFGRIRDQVLTKTGNRQEPFVYGALGGSVVAIVPASNSIKPAQISSTYEGARHDYDLVAKIGTTRALEIFLGSYPTGLFAELARSKLAELRLRESTTCLLDCIGNWLHANTCDGIGDVCLEMAEKRCRAVLANSLGKCGSEVSPE